MNVGDYVQVKVPSSNKIVAGLIEDINSQTNSAVVRLRSSSDAANSKRDETITVPLASLQSLGVSHQAHNDTTIGGSYQASSPSSPSAMLLEHGKYKNSSSFDASAVPKKPSSSSSSVVDPFRNFDDAGTLGRNSLLLDDGHSSSAGGGDGSANNSVLLRELRAKQASVGFYRHGIFSKYVWEFLSPVALLLRAERPLFSVGFVILYLIIHFCVSAPREVVQTACFGVSRLIRDARGTPLPSTPSSAVSTFRLLLNGGDDVGVATTMTAITTTKIGDDDDDDRKLEVEKKQQQQQDEKPSLKKSFEQTVSKNNRNDDGNTNNNKKKARPSDDDHDDDKQGKKKSAAGKKKKESSSSLSENNNKIDNKKSNHNNSSSSATKSTPQQQQQQQQQIETKSEIAASSSITDIVIDEIDQFFEENIIFKIRIFLRDAGLLFEDLISFSNSFIPFSHIQPTETLFGQVCHQLKELAASSSDDASAIVIPDLLEQDIKTIARKFSMFFYCIILCYMWSGSVRCEILSSAPSLSGSFRGTNKFSSSSLSSSNKSSSTSLEKQAKFQDEEEENRLLDDAVEGDEITTSSSSSTETETQPQQQQQQQEKSTRAADEEGDVVKNNSFTSRFRFKIQEKEFIRRHNRMKKLEVEIHYPDIALARFLKEFTSPIVMHLAVVFVVAVMSWCFAIVEENPVGRASGSQYKIVYSAAWIEAIFSPIGDWILGVSLIVKNLTFEFWLLQSFTLNIVINNVSALFKKKRV